MSTTVFPCIWTFHHWGFTAQLQQTDCLIAVLSLCRRTLKIAVDCKRLQTGPPLWRNHFKGNETASLLHTVAIKTDCNVKRGKFDTWLREVNLSQSCCFILTAGLSCGWAEGWALIIVYMCQQHSNPLPSKKTEFTLMWEVQNHHTSP